jgi:hypothetical protein
MTQSKMSSFKKTIVGLAPEDHTLELPLAPIDATPTVPRIALRPANPTMLGIAPGSPYHDEPVRAVEAPPSWMPVSWPQASAPASFAQPSVQMAVAPAETGPVLWLEPTSTATLDDLPIERPNIVVMAVAALGAVAWVMMTIAVLTQ